MGFNKGEKTKNQLVCCEQEQETVQMILENYSWVILTLSAEPTHNCTSQVPVAWLPGYQVDKEDTENSVPFQCI